MDKGEIGARLRDELERDPDMSIRRLSREVRDWLKARHRSTAGTSYGTIRSYVEGEVYKPRRGVLEACAAVLGVRPEWLVEGVEPRTERGAQMAEEAAADATRAADEADLPIAGGTRLWNAVARLPIYRILERNDDEDSRHRDLQVGLVWMAARMGAARLDDNDLEHFLRGFEFLLTLPYRLVVPRDRESGPIFSRAGDPHYVRLMLAAMGYAVDRRNDYWRGESRGEAMLQTVNALARLGEEDVWVELEVADAPET